MSTRTVAPRRSLIRRLLVVLVLASGGMLMASPAWAHGGPVDVEIRGDGGQGLTALATYHNDKHPVNDRGLDLTFTAVSSEGRTLGPERLVASNEGQGLYLSNTPLPAGHWTVTVTLAQPHQTYPGVPVDSRVLATPPARGGGGSNLALVLGLGGAVIVLGCAVTVGLILRRPRTAS
jgi:hypothetical protein